MFDPFGILADAGLQGDASPMLPPPLKGKSPIQPLDKATEDSMLQQVVGKGLSGMSYIGNSLGKAFGGRALRGVLGGKPEEIASIIPFSDALGITDENNAVSGEDLAKKWGVLEGEGEKGTFEARDLVGPLIEAGLDPATYLTFGGSALSKGGQVARAAGVLPKGGAVRAGTTLGSLMASATPEVRQAIANAAQGAGHALGDISSLPLGGHMGIGLPFSTPLKTFDMTGPLGVAGKAASLAGRFSGVSALGDMIGAPQLYREGRALLDRSVAGARTALGQAEAPLGYEATKKATAELKLKQAEWMRLLHGEGLMEDGARFRRMAEGLEAPTPAAQRVLDESRAYRDALHDQTHALGSTPRQLLEDDVIQGYFPRQQAQVPKDTAGFTGPAVKLREQPGWTPALEAREEILKHFPGGTEGLNQLTVDPALSGLKGTLNPHNVTAAIEQNAKNIRYTHLGLTPADDATLAALENKLSKNVLLTPVEQAEYERIKPLVERSAGLADWLAGLDPAYAKGGIPFFGNHPLQDFETTTHKLLGLRSSLDTNHNILAKSAVTAGFAKPGFVPLEESLTKAGFTNLPNARMQIVDRLTDMGKLQPVAPNQINQAVKQFYVDPAHLADLTRSVEGFKTPAALQPILKVADSFTNLFKAGATGLWPGFHVRNFGTGLWQNAVTGSGGLSPVMKARQLLTGGAVEGAENLPIFRGMNLTREQATARLADMAYAHGINASTQTGEVTGHGLAQAERMLHQIPGQAPPISWGGELKGAVTGLATPEGRNPLNIAGVAGNTKDRFAPVRAGKRIGTEIENTNRLADFISRIERGEAPSVAAEGVKGTHFDYSRGSSTAFENDVLKRGIPFYSYARQNIPFQARQLLEKPGGAVGQAIRVSNDLRDQSGFVPPYLGNGLAIGVGGEENGTKRYLTSLGLPYEQAFELLRPGPKGAENTMMAALGQTNPLLKAPLEYATGKQFYTGRDLEDLYSPTGSTALEQVMMNSPLGRAYTTGRTLLDDRKGIGPKALNLATGLKLTDVDVEKQRNVTAREILKEELHGRPHIRNFTELYVRPEDAPMLSPRDLALLRLNRTLEKEAQDHARQTRAALGR
jgi:hypothetical protein